MQFWNASLSIEVPPFITMVFKLLLRTYEIAIVGIVAFSIGQFLNAELPIEVTLSGITMLVRDVQPENALFPTLVTLSGITMLVSDVQP